jgi:hypothetical protein
MTIFKITTKVISGVMNIAQFQTNARHYCNARELVSSAVSQQNEMPYGSISVQRMSDILSSATHQVTNSTG